MTHQPDDMKVRAAIYSFLILLVFLSFSQDVAYLPEGEVPPKIIVKHYSNYDNGLKPRWFQFEANGAERYGVRFSQNQVEREVIYNQYGRAVQESMIRDAIPVILADFIDGRYEKFKILEFRSVKDLEQEVMQYEVMMKTKMHGEFSLRFDNQFMLMDNASGLAYE